jgi:tetratricopeptide (TPR) repeat protein
VNDFNIAVNLDGNYAEVYLERAKMYFKAENYSKALEDLARFSELRPEEDAEYHKAVLYLVNGLYPMA